MTLLRYWPFAVIVAFVLTVVGFIVFEFMVYGEEICLDRHPWWGPPENPTSECSGLWYADKHPGEFPWTMPR